MILFDQATARDLHDALRLLRGKFLGTDRRMSEGANDIFEAAERSLRVRTDQPSTGPVGAGEDDAVLSLLTVADVADRLHLSPATVKRRVAAGEIKSVRIGRARRVRPADLQQFIANLEEPA